MSQENVEIVKAAYEADYRGDEQAMLELLAEDVIVKNPRGLLDVPAVRHGRQGWRDLVAEFREVFDDFVPDVKEWVDAGDWVLCVTHWTGRAKGSGVAVEANQVDAVRVREGRIVEMNLSYRSREAALKALGLSE
jgi:ketosteroid isomerase-like protein